MASRNVAAIAVDSGAFNELMEKTYKKVFSLAYRLAGDRNDAEDLTQEAYYRAYRSFGDYEGDKPFENWIFRIVTRLFLDLLRARKRRIQPVSLDSPLIRESTEELLFFEVADSAPDPEAQFVDQTFSEDLQLAYNALSSEQRMLVMLADVQQMPYKEIALLMDKPVGTIRSRLHRAHKQMRAKLLRLREGRAPTESSS